MGFPWTTSCKVKVFMPPSLLMTMLTAAAVCAILVATSKQHRDLAAQGKSDAQSTLVLVSDVYTVLGIPGAVISEAVVKRPGPQDTFNYTQHFVQDASAKVPGVSWVELIFQANSSGYQRGTAVNNPIALQQALASTIQTRQPMILGEPPASNLLVSIIPVFVPATSQSDTWGWSSNDISPMCLPNGTVACYNNMTQTRWWGHVVTAFDLSAILTTLPLAFNTHRHLQYTWRLELLQTVPAALSQQSQFVVAANGTNDRCQSPQQTLNIRLTSGIQASLTYCMSKGWFIPWLIPLIVLSIILSFGMAALFSLILTKWRQVDKIVEALFPEHTRDQVEELLDLKPACQQRDLVPTGSPAERITQVLQKLLLGEFPPSKDVIQCLVDLSSKLDRLHVPDQMLQLETRSNIKPEALSALRLALTSADGDKKDSAVGGKVPACAAAACSTPGSSRAASRKDNLQVKVQEEDDSLLWDDAMTRILSVRTPKSAGNAKKVILPNQIASETSNAIFVAKPASSNPRPAPSPANLKTMTSFEQVDLDSPWEHSDANNFLTDGFGMLVRPALHDQLEEMLIRSGKMDGGFDAMKLAEISGGHPLAAMAYWAFQQAGLLKTFDISSNVLIQFLHTVEGAYLDNPYHNSTHAAHVLQNTHMILCTGGLRSGYADDLQVLACYIAAVLHDYEHKGVTNDHLINTSDHLAAVYNDRAPHENHHVSAGLLMMAKEENNFLAHLPKMEMVKLRKLVIELVLATDMKQHFTLSGQFSALHAIPTAETVRNMLRSDGQSTLLSASTSNKARQKLGLGAVVHYHRAMGNSSLSLPSGPIEATAVASFSHGAMLAPLAIDEADQLLALQMLLKCADLGHTYSALPMHLQWVSALEEEMFRQGDREKSLNMTVSPLCDRLKGGITDSQVGFYEVVVLPLLVTFSSRFPACKSLLDSAFANYQHWKSTSSQAAA